MGTCSLDVDSECYVVIMSAYWGCHEPIGKSSQLCQALYVLRSNTPRDEESILSQYSPSRYLVLPTPVRGRVDMCSNTAKRISTVEEKCVEICVAH